MDLSKKHALVGKNCVACGSCIRVCPRGAITVLGFLTMVLFRPRSWCSYCPMGTMTQLICQLKHKNDQKTEYVPIYCKNTIESECVPFYLYFANQSE